MTNKCTCTASTSDKLIHPMHIS